MLQTKYDQLSNNTSQLQSSYQTLSKNNSQLQDEVEQLEDRTEGKKSLKLVNSCIIHIYIMDLICVVTVDYNSFMLLNRVNILKGNRNRGKKDL